MGTKSSKPVEISPTPQIVDDENEICDRTLKIEIVDDDFQTGKSTDDDPTVQSPEDQQTNRVITLNVCSTKLANKSPFFDKMFSIGMKESTEEVVTLKICAYEKAAFMEMMDYVKSNKLSSKSYKELLELLMIADRFEVPSCTKSCVDLLLSLPMDHELALLVRDIPRCIFKIGDIRRLTDEAKAFFNKLKNFQGFPDDIGEINQAVIEGLLSRNNLCLDSEDSAYDFLMKWVTSHFTDSDERREFLRERVRKLVRFAYMSNSKLSSFYECPYVDDELRKEIKLELESYEKEKKRMEAPQPKKLLYIKRLYKYLPVTVKELENNDKRYEVFLGMDKRDCRNLAKVRSHRTCTFRVEEQDFYLVVDCKYNMEKKPSTLGIRLHAGSAEEDEGNLRRLMRIRLEVAYEKSHNEFVTRASKVTVLNRRKSNIGFDHLFGIEWNRLMSINKGLFINGTMVIRVAIHIN